MWFLFDILHHLNFFLVAAMMLFATIFNYDLGKDRKFAPFLLVIIPLFLCLMEITAYIYISKISSFRNMDSFISEESLTFLVYFGSFFTNILICLFLLGTLRYIIILFAFKERTEKLFSWAALFYVIAAFVINMVFLWNKAMENSLTLTSMASWSILSFDSIIFIVPAVYALIRSVRLRVGGQDKNRADSDVNGSNKRGPHKRQIAGTGDRTYRRGIMVSFLPVPLFAIFDIAGIDTGLILQSTVPFRTTFISYTIFVIWSLYHLMQDKVEHTRPIIDKQDQRTALKNCGISEREIEIIEEVAQGNANKDIANALFISENTVKSHIKNIYRKLEISNRIQLLKLLEKLRIER